MSARGLRRIAPLATAHLQPGGVDTDEPKFARVKPTDLLVDATYQRDLSERSTRLIYKMVRNWSWRSFTPPLCVQVDDGMHVIDGQHTAIAASMHPKIKTIPVMVVSAPKMVDRALAFVGRNRDRIMVTPNQMFYAAVAAGDEDAMTVHQVCERAKVVVLRGPAQRDYANAGETAAISAIYALVARRGAMRARQVLEVCARAKLAPISMAVIRAVEHLLLETLPPAKADDIVYELRGGGIRLINQAGLYAMQDKTPLWRGLAKALARRLKP